jgi:hypothetical protein
LKDLIVAGRDNNGLIQFQNLGANRLLGANAELSGVYKQVEIAGSIAIQNDYDLATRNILPNSPREVVKLRVAVPLFRHQLTAA